MNNRPKLQAITERYTPLLLPVLYMSLIFFLSGRPAPEPLQQMPVLFGMKLVHLLEYGLLAILWFRGLRLVTTWSPCAVNLVAVAITFAWGISDEIHQSFVPGRTARVEDAFTNLVAAVGAVWLWRLVHAIRKPL